MDDGSGAKGESTGASEWQQTTVLIVPEERTW